MYILKKELRVSKAEREAFESLPENLPETKLTQKQKDLVRSMYYKYIGRTIDNIDWSTDLDDLEMQEKWPSGARMKRHEAQRIVLGFVLNLNQRMTNKEAAKCFYSAMNGRKAYIEVKRRAYDCK